MKIKFIVLFLCVVLVIPAFGAKAKVPKRYSVEVDNVHDAYEGDWVVSPDEKSDTANLGGYAECEIQGTISSFDADSIRVDILLNSAIKKKSDVMFAVKFVYEGGMEEWYTYYPNSDEFIYEKLVNGKTTKTTTLNNEEGDDEAFVTSSGKDVAIIINKDKHIGGESGNQLYLTTYFCSGYVDKKGKLQIADDTIDVNLYFTR